MEKVRCSIEMEPKTLSEGQLNHAREVAADLVEKMEPTEASAIFIEEMRKVASRKEMVEIVDHKEELQVHSKPVEWKEEEPQVLEIPCQCFCSAVIESPDQETRLIEPLSAPF